MHRCYTSSQIFSIPKTPTALLSISLSSLSSLFSFFLSVFPHPIHTTLPVLFQTKQALNLLFLPLGFLWCDARDLTWIAASTASTGTRSMWLNILLWMLKQPVKSIVDGVARINLTRDKSQPRILTHTDAGQAIGKITVDTKHLGVDYLTIVGHKVTALLDFQYVKQVILCNVK